MVKIGLLSDTHGDFPEQIFTYFKDVDEIWHAGDIGDLNVTDRIQAFKPLRAVYGNIDDHQARITFDEHLIFTLEGVKVVMTHIGGKPGKYSKPAFELIQKHQPQLFICGHSHIVLVKNDPLSNLLWMNPGAAGNKGFHQIKTLLRFQLNAGRIEQLELIELGKRSSLNNSNEI